MRVLVAPDSFKGSLSALEAAKAMERGVLRVFPQAVCDLAPIADGGEGTVDALVRATRGRAMTTAVRGPLGETVQAAWGLLGDGRTAVIEMAAASGLPLLDPGGLDPLRACSYGTGQLIAAALKALHAASEAPGGERAPFGSDREGENPGQDQEGAGPPRLIIGIGGSATNDGGAGCFRALGARFLDASGRELPFGGEALADLADIDCSRLDPLLQKTEIWVACDVDNPLCGPRGASAVFGPQKGASPAMVDELDAALARYSRVARRVTGKDAADAPGAGAAGGLGAGLMFFSRASLLPGVDIVLRAVEMEARMESADVILTGEGHTDSQTAYGKAPVGVARLARKRGKPVICVSGGMGRGADAVLEQGVQVVTSCICSITTLEECMKNAATLLEDAVARNCRLLRLGMALAARGVPHDATF